ncbi:dynein axonemal heavy chain 3-like [Planococcus citri]|uniref:dynein axonemal heavy chain 3-like n=1 Tax=Planococcus citri TaxID=170843 RepID=UPI0031F7E8A0
MPSLNLVLIIYISTRDLQNKRKLLEKSLQRLSVIKEQIPFLERECETLQPTIHDKKIQVERLENEVEAEKEVETEAEITTNGAKTTLKNCEKKLNSRKQEFEQQVAQIQVVWENVCENLQSLSSTDITLLKTMKNPPKPLKAVVEALAIIKVVFFNNVALFLFLIDYF